MEILTGVVHREAEDRDLVSRGPSDILSHQQLSEGCDRGFSVVAFSFDAARLLQFEVGVPVGRRAELLDTSDAF